MFRCRAHKLLLEVRCLGGLMKQAIGFEVFFLGAGGLTGRVLAFRV